MKPVNAIIVFISFITPSVLLCYGNYTTAKENIIEDVNQALAKTILTEPYNRITADTLNTYKSNLRISQLKKTSYLALCTEEPSKVSFCSDTMSYMAGNETLHIRAYPNCTKAAIFSMSDQTIPGILFMSSLLWGIFSLVYLHKKNASELNTCSDLQMFSCGNLFFSESADLFYNNKKEPIYFTPMQLSLMKMLIMSDNKRLSTEEICHNLWPGKDNAKESLYTLIRRLKPVVESNSNVKITSDKGGYYTLSVKHT